jgi:F0F1-type ATP synthase membrane subunit b/b'
MLQYLDDAQAKRTGVSDMQQGLNPDVLQNVTAAAVAASTAAAGGKLELVARIFAETGVKTLFQGILQLLCKYQDKPTVMRLRGKYVPVDPREWSNQYDVDISVGLGTGSKAEQMTMLQMVLAKQEAILQQFGPNNPLVSVGQYRGTLGRFIEAAGFTDSAEFFKEITPEIEAQLAQPKQPQPDPTTAALIQQSQAQIQIAQQKAQADVQAAQQKAMADIQLQREKAAAEIQLMREKTEAQMALKARELEAEIQLKAAELSAGIVTSANIRSV